MATVIGICVIFALVVAGMAFAAYWDRRRGRAVASDPQRRGRVSPTREGERRRE